MTEDPLASLHAAVEACAEAGAAYAVIGAMARNAWAPPRATTDIDIAVSVAPEAYDALVAALQGRGFIVSRTLRADPDDTVPDVLLLERSSGVVRRLDVLIAKTPFEREAIDRAVMHDIGAPCRVVRPEHLIVYKLIAGRPRDFADAEDVWRTRELAAEALDMGLIERWTREWGVEGRLQQLVRDHHRS